ncbi:MAG: hypothetical protein LBN08_05255 [Lactobacillales bacterium]|jgi:hypothetical protein|nr:hypothetical protein [Lactobacillales bacterium]
MKKGTVLTLGTIVLASIFATPTSTLAATSGVSIDPTIQLDLDELIKQGNIADNLPDSINPLGSERETPVRDQGGTQLCWAYSTSDILGIDQYVQTGYKMQYSPNFLNYLTAGETLGDSVNPYANWVAPSDYRWLGGPGDGRLAATDFQVHGIKPVKEADFATSGGALGTKDDASGPDFVGNPLEGQGALDSLLNAGDSSYDIQNVQEVKAVRKNISSVTVAQHTQELKTLIAKYGASDLAMNVWLLNENFPDNGGPLNKETYALNIPFGLQKTATVTLTNGTKRGITFLHPDHEVTIVGYDDNYSKNNFNEKFRPRSNGAFLVKNSFGTANAKDGYCWISYESQIFTDNDEFAFQLGAHDEHKVAQNVLTTDEAYLNPDSFSQYDGKFYSAETFDAVDYDRNIEAVNAILVAENTGFKVSLIEGDLNLGEDDLESGNALKHRLAYEDFAQNSLKTVTGTAKFAHAKKIPFSYTLEAGHKYTVVVEQTIPEEASDVDYNIAETPYKTAEEVAGESYYGVISGGTVYSIDLHRDDLFVGELSTKVIGQNNISLDYK